MNRRLHRALFELGGVAPLAMVALLLANDHLLKRLFHNALTGKLSDVAICFLIPLLVSAVLGVAVTWRLERRLWVGAAIAVVVFSLLELSDAAGGIFSRAMEAIGWGPVVLTRDVTDLFALSCVPLAVAHGRRPRRPLHPRLATAAGAAALVFGSMALMATSAPPCEHWSAPVVFQADAGCGPGGIIVVESGPGRGASLFIANPQALGLPPLNVGDDPNTRAQGAVLGAICPSAVESGNWQVQVGFCTSSGSGTMTCSPNFRDCDASFAEGALVFACRGADPAALELCRSRLTVLR